MIMHRIRRSGAYLSGEGLGPFLIKAVAGSGAVRVGAMAASFAVGVQLARLLGVEGYGYYGLALSIITVVGIPGELGVSKLVTREVAAAIGTDDRPRLFGALHWGQVTVLRLSLLMAALAVGGTFLVAASYPSVPALAVLFGAPIIPLMAMARVNGGALQGLHHVVRGQIPANLLRPLILSLSILAASIAQLRIGVAGAMVLNSFAAALVAAVAFVWLQHRLPEGKPVTIVRTGRQWLASSIPMALTDGMRTLQSELSILLIGIIAAPTAVGLFRVASATAVIAAAAMPMVAQVALPTFARLYAERDAVRLQKAVTAFAAVQFGGVLLLCLPLLAFPDLLLKTVFGESFGPAAPVLRILAVGQIVNSAFGPNAVLLNMTHHERRVTRAMGIALIVNLALVPILALKFGISGAAIGLVSAILTWNVIAWYDARRLLGIDTSIVVRGFGRAWS